MPGRLHCPHQAPHPADSPEGIPRHFGHPDDAVSWLRQRRFDVYLADTEGAENYRSVSYAGRRAAFVLGAERYGIANAWAQPDFQRVCVPMLGHADSLNVSVSAAVLLYEARAQQDGW